MHELRLAVAALQAEVVGLRESPAVQIAAAPVAAAPTTTTTIEPVAAEPAVPELPSTTLLLPLAWAALKAGVPVDGVLPVDLGPDTADTEIVLAPAAEISLPEALLPEAPLLDPRLARVAEAFDELMDSEGRTGDLAAVVASQRETA